MAHFPDLAPETPITRGPHVRAVGWLSPDVAFPRGESPARFIDRLRALCSRWGECVELLGWPVAAGPHTCEFCGEYRAAGNVGVPHGELLFVSPEMIAHYVEAHSYRPPDDFILAVLAAPEPGGPDFAAAAQRFRHAQAVRS